MSMNDLFSKFDRLKPAFGGLYYYFSLTFQKFYVIGKDYFSQKLKKIK